MIARWLLLLIAMLAVLAPALVGAQERFQPGCTLPFDAIARDHPISDVCGAEGDTEKEPHKAQNRAKNNFCAKPPAVPVSYQTFIDLQRAVDRLKAQDRLDYGSSNSLPKDRSVVERIVKASNGRLVGEGSLVQYVAFMAHPRNSNVKKGESVNCKKGGAENNDIHIELARRPNNMEAACKTITAEITPHFRPEYWEVQKLRLLRSKPVRVTGHLFFDASHVPCRPEKSANPKRASVWEIHPVYHIDVCDHDTLKACTVGGKHWVPLHEWLNKEQEEEDENEGDGRRR